MKKDGKVFSASLALDSRLHDHLCGYIVDLPTRVADTEDHVLTIPPVQSVR